MMETTIWQNDVLRLEMEPSEIPWLKLFTQNPYKEMSDVPAEVRFEIFERLDAIEREMIAYFKPDKINIASFGNYVPHVHWHIMARFESDSHFPEPMWGEKRRDAELSHLPPLAPFIENVVKKMEAL
jgi:diadenosine tetraphosphate (Ap4A) HIT family hydrolase